MKTTTSAPNATMSVGVTPASTLSHTSVPVLYFHTSSATSAKVPSGVKAYLTAVFVRSVLACRFGDLYARSP